MTQRDSDKFIIFFSKTRWNKYKNIKVFFPRKLKRLIECQSSLINLVCIYFYNNKAWKAHKALPSNILYYYAQMTLPCKIFYWQGRHDSINELFCLQWVVWVIDGYMWNKNNQIKTCVGPWEMFKTTYWHISHIAKCLFGSCLECSIRGLL